MKLVDINLEREMEGLLVASSSPALEIRLHSAMVLIENSEVEFSFLQTEQEISARQLFLPFPCSGAELMSPDRKCLSNERGSKNSCEAQKQFT